jgi:hypothetical protein
MRSTVEQLLAVLAGLGLAACNKQGSDDEVAPERAAPAASSPTSPVVGAKEVPAAAASAPPVGSAKAEPKMACAPGGCAAGACGGDKKK